MTQLMEKHSAETVTPHSTPQHQTPPPAAKSGRLVLIVLAILLIAGALAVARRLTDEDHIIRPGPNINRRDIAPTQALDRAAVSAKQRRTVDLGGVRPDHRLATTPRHPGGRRLVRHPFGESERVSERLFFGRIGPHPGAAKGRPDPGAMDGDDAPIPAGRVRGEHHFLMSPYRCSGKDSSRFVISRWRHVNSLPG